MEQHGWMLNRKKNIMSRTTIIQPYEFLVRFKDNKISGSHIQQIEYVYEGNKELFHHIHDPQPVTENGDFPLKDILDQIHIAALATIEILNKEIATLQLQIKDLKVDKTSE